MENFHDWVAGLREDNARKRAVRAALNGTGHDLPASAAACPSTNPTAMDVADEEGVVTKWKGFKKGKKKKDEEGDDDDSEDDSQSECVQLEREKTPDYTIDKVLRDLEGFRTEVGKKLSDLDKEEEDSEKKKSDIVKKVKEIKPKNTLGHEDEPEEGESPEEEKSPWERFKDKKEPPWKKNSLTAKLEEK